MLVPSLPNAQQAGEPLVRVFPMIIMEKSKPQLDYAAPKLEKEMFVYLVSLFLSGLLKLEGGLFSGQQFPPFG